MFEASVVGWLHLVKSTWVEGREEFEFELVTHLLFPDGVQTYLELDFRPSGLRLEIIRYNSDLVTWASVSRKKKYKLYKKSCTLR
jgi:hypothetical protein